MAYDGTLIYSVIMYAIPCIVFQSLDQYYGPKRWSHGFQLATVLNRIKYRGFIKLQSTDPYQHPIIDLLYLSHPDDVKTALEGKISCGFKRPDALGLPRTGHSYCWLKEFPKCFSRGKTPRPRRLYFGCFIAGRGCATFLIERTKPNKFCEL